MGTGIGRWYEKRIGRFVPYYAVISLLCCFLWNCFIYWATQLAYGDRDLHNLTTAFDDMVPFRSEWVIVYIASYLFWVVCYMEIAKANTRENWFRFVFCDLLSRTICGIIFIGFPTTNTRPEVTGDTLWDWLMNLIYGLDMPYNLFPSMHCLISMLCFLGLMGAGGLTRRTKALVLICTLLIFVSTQFTKQHYFVDVIGGVAVAVGAFALAHKSDLYAGIERFFEKINIAVFGKK